MAALVLKGFSVALYGLVTLMIPLALQLLFLYYLCLLLQRLLYKTLGFGPAVYFTAPGTVIHEMSHFVACIFTGTPVVEVTLFSPHEKPPGSGKWILGEVVRGNSSYFGSLVISIAPFFGCTLLLFIATKMLVPAFTIPAFPYRDIAAMTPDSIGSAFSFMITYLGTYYFYLIDFMMALCWTDWRTYLFFLFTLSLAPGIAPSSGDIKHFFSALAICAALLVPFFMIAHFCGYPVISMTRQGAGSLIIEISSYLGISTMMTMGGCIFLTLIYLAKFIVEEIKKGDCPG